MSEQSSEQSLSPVAWELAKACAGFSGTLDGQVKASLGLSTGQVIEGTGNTTIEALHALVAELDRWEGSR